MINQQGKITKKGKPDPECGHLEIRKDRHNQKSYETTLGAGPSR